MSILHSTTGPLEHERIMITPFWTCDGELASVRVRVSIAL